MATSGVVLVVLTVSGLRTWWPMQRYRRTALSSHWRTQRLSRDTDLFKAAGLVLLPLLFLWGYYASVFSIRPTQPASPVSMTGYQSLVEPTSTGQDQDIGPHRAVAAAQEAGGGQAVALFLPEPGDPSSTYTIWVSQGERVTPRQSHNSVAVNVDPGTGEPRSPPRPPASRPLERVSTYDTCTSPLVCARSHITRGTEIGPLVADEPQVGAQSDPYGTGMSRRP